LWFSNLSKEYSFLRLRPDFLPRGEYKNQKRMRARGEDVGGYFCYLATVYLHLGAGDKGRYFRFQGTMYLKCV